MQFISFTVLQLLPFAITDSFGAIALSTNVFGESHFLVHNKISDLQSILSNLVLIVKRTKKTAQNFSIA